MNIEEAIKDLGNELTELTGDNYAKIARLEKCIEARAVELDVISDALEERMEKLEQEVQNTFVFTQGFHKGQQLRIKTLENALADTCCDHELLMRLVIRIGYDVQAHNLDLYPYTVIGQREYDAAMHDAEGAPVTREDCVP